MHFRCLKVGCCTSAVQPQSTARFSRHRWPSACTSQVMLAPNDDTIQAFPHEPHVLPDGQVHTSLSGSLEHGTMQNQ